MISPCILVVASQPAIVYSLNAMLADSSYRAEESPIGAEATARVQRNPIPDLVFLELGSGDGGGLQTLQELRSSHPDLKVVVLSAKGDTRLVADAIRLGAHDYLNVPLQESELQRVLVRHLGDEVSEGVAGPADRAEEFEEGQFFVAASPVMRKVRVQAELLANIDVPVLILGESGTGKEVTAHLIHELSPRSKRKFLKVNCAALPGELLERELFGYERGAFTGATQAKVGTFELCQKGTILLDEIGEMSANLQARLLHVLRDKQFFRLGGDTMIEVDVRILAATNIKVEEAIQERRFREDLYYRLSAFTITLPPLRERQEEIPMLLRYFISRMATQHSRPAVRFSPTLIKACQRYPWPGNLRELENFVKRFLVIGDEAMALADLKAIGRENHVVLDIPSGPVPPLGATTMSQAPTTQWKSVLHTLKAETEVNAISRALEETRWNRKEAAQLLRISYRGLLYKIQQYELTPPTAYSSTFIKGERWKGNA
jgi:two-component system, NtrC family, response regulator AtoC